MRQEFREYYTPTETEFSTLWKNAFFAFDANVLLNLYTYSNQAREEILSAFGEIKERLWLPYWAGREFHRNRAKIILQEAKRYSELGKQANNFCDELAASKRHPHVSDHLLQQLRDTIQKVRGELDTEQETLKAFLTDDPILTQLSDLFEGRVGNAYTEQELESIFKEGEKRYGRRIPPGFKDDNKPLPEKFGDLIIWKQAIRQATSDNQACIFITDDLKEDWWRIEDDQRLGPHPELIREFTQETQQTCHIYSGDSFIEKAKIHIQQAKVSEETIREVREAAEDRRKSLLKAHDLIVSKHFLEQISRLEELQATSEARQKRMDEFVVNASNFEALEKMAIVARALQNNPTVAVANKLRKFVEGIRIAYPEVSGDPDASPGILEETEIDGFPNNVDSDTKVNDASPESDN